MSRMIQYKFKLYRTLQVVLAFLLMLSCGTDPISATSAHAANGYHVAKTGNDSNPGTQAAPFQTLQQAVTAAKPGDVVYVHAGTYSGIRIYPAGGIGSSGEPGKPIVYRAYGDGTVTIDGGSGAAIWIEGAYLEFYGFKLTSSSESSQGNIGIFLAGKDSQCCSQAGTKYIRFVDCEIFGCSEQGILGGADNCEFLNLDVHHNGKTWFTDQGFYLTGSGNRIIGCKIHDNASSGIQLWHTSNDPTAVPNHTLIANNLIYGNGFAVVTNDPNYPQRNQYGYGIVIGSNRMAGDGNIIQNNLIYGNFPFGLSLSSLGSNTKILNNTIVANIVGLSLDDQATGVIIKNNIVYANSANAVRSWLQSYRPELLQSVDPNRHGSGSNLNASGMHGGSVFDGYTIDYNLWDPGFPFTWKGISYSSFSAYQSASGKDTHALATDPKLQNLINNFHLQLSSPAIDAGIAVPEVNTDIEGKPRPQGSRFDIGAYETGGGGTMSATINVSPTSGLIPLTVSFNATAYSGTSPYSYLWDFGDGNSSTQQNPQHLFAQAGSYVVKLTVTDANGNKATASATIVATDPAAENPSVVNIKFANLGQTAALTTIEADSWYDLYLVLLDPQGWNNLSYADVWFNHTSNTQGTIENRGGDHFAASNYVLSYSITDSAIWAKETEGTSDWANLTGKLGLYVDDNANEYKQNDAQKWAKARVKLLGSATPGTWSINAFVWDRDQHQSVLMTKTVNVVPKDPAPTASIRANGPFSQQGGTYRVTLTTSNPVVKMPMVLLFIDSGGSTSTIQLTGTVPGSSFTGQLLKNSDLKEGNGCFALTPGALVDQAGHEGNNIVKGKILKIDWPPSTPQNVNIQPPPGSLAN